MHFHTNDFYKNKTNKNTRPSPCGTQQCPVPGTLVPLVPLVPLALCLSLALEKGWATVMGVNPLVTEATRGPAVGSWGCFVFLFCGVVCEVA